LKTLKLIGNIQVINYLFLKYEKTTILINRTGIGVMKNAIAPIGRSYSGIG